MIYLDDNLKIECPVCDTVLSRKQIMNGKRLARCSKCGRLLRIVREEEQEWAEARATESPATAFQWSSNDEGFSAARSYPDKPNLPKDGASKVWAEVAPRYPYPNLQCPYCEYLNYDSADPRRQTQQFCGNCGADLKKECAVCGYPLYVLDHFCGRCRTDQELAEYELEALYWQHYNEGKRLAKSGAWEAALRELTLFFGPEQEVAEHGYSPEQFREARRFYRSGMSRQDQGEGLRLYNECHEQLRQGILRQERNVQRRKVLKYAAAGAVLVIMGIWSSLNLGTWWAIFVIIPAVGLIVAFLVLMLLFHFGVGLN